jgi:hypothetical protein
MHGPGQRYLEYLADKMSPLTVANPSSEETYDEYNLVSASSVAIVSNLDLPPHQADPVLL